MAGTSSKQYLKYPIIFLITINEKYLELTNNDP